MEYIKVEWPESQVIMNLSESQKQNYGVELSAENSYFIPKENYEEVMKAAQDADSKIVLYTDDESDWLSRESYRSCYDLADDEDVEGDPNDDENYYNWVYDCKSSYLEDMREALRRNPQDSPVIITGTVGSWFSKRAIMPAIVSSSDGDSNTWTAIRKCTSLSGDVSFTITLNKDDGSLEITVSHHDGTNCFTLRKVAKESWDLIDWLENEGEDDEHKYSDIVYTEFTSDEFEL